ncbi:hypothetical protein CRG98_041830 [Punica granatum]|uniref:Uncharacterized protein n=1 Tax=Punica granatum TaxID=22663 RepID=A0A2I0I234_PUNGR|nr:hypothetical protein CRG98_041830 [Punica granatum]
MRILAEAELEEAEWAKQRYEQLNFTDEKRLKALCHGQCCAHPNLISSGHACAKPIQRGLGVPTFPWGCATDTREKESPLTVYDP